MASYVCERPPPGLTPEIVEEVIGTQPRMRQPRSEPVYFAFGSAARAEDLAPSQILETATTEALAQRLPLGGPAPRGLESLAPHEFATPPVNQVPSHLGGWMSAALAPRQLWGPEGIRKASAIVDRAVKNIEHARALDELIATAHGLQPGSSSLARSAALLRAQIEREQLQVLAGLESLRARHGQQGAAAAAAIAGAPSAGAPAASPKGGSEAARRGQRQQPQSLTLSMQSLSREDPETLFTVRQIAKLGFKAPQALKRHFSSYGAVARVLVANSAIRQPGSADGFRQRPSNLGFVQMASKEAAKAILAAGPEQEVEGVAIRLEKFGQQKAKAISGGRAERDVACAPERRASTCSDCSLASMSTCISEDVPGWERPAVGGGPAEEDSE